MTIELADDNERPVSGGGESLPNEPEWVLVGSNEDTRIYKTPEAAAALEAMIMSVTGDEEAEIDVATMALFDGSIQGTARAMMGPEPEFTHDPVTGVIGGGSTSVSDQITRRYTFLRRMAMEDGEEILNLVDSINANPTTNDEFDAVIDEALRRWEG